MARKIKYKPVSKELEHIVKPVLDVSTRTSVGLDQVVGEYYYINVEELYPFKNQARKNFNDEAIIKLADSIKEHGVRQPLSVKKSIDGKYEVVSGERRLRAAKIANLYKVPCIVLTEDIDANAVALIENIHRADLHPIELGSAYKQLIKDQVFENQEKLSQGISVAKSTVSEYIKLSNIPEDIKTYAIQKNIISRDKLRSLLKANKSNNIEEMRSLVGLGVYKNRSFSVLRISSLEGEIKIQDLGITKLTPKTKEIVKKHLKKIITQIDSC
jgi:ParB family chromosome partitioning protein